MKYLPSALLGIFAVGLMFGMGHQAGLNSQTDRHHSHSMLDFYGAISTQTDLRLHLSYWNRLATAATTVLVIDPLAPDLKDLRQTILLGPWHPDNAVTTATIDVASGPLAGEEVRLFLVAVPKSGQPAIVGGVRTVKLPARRFYHPLARQLITLRRELLRPTPNLTFISAQLDMLSREPDIYDGDRTIFAALRSAVYRLRSPDEDDQAHSTAGWLWQIALDLEGDSPVTTAASATANSVWP